jgi:short-subunit dehydrogenase
MANQANSKSVLITGASSGIGAALADAYAQPGSILVLAGRDRARLDAVVRKCESRGATTIPWVIDVSQVEPYLAQLAALDDCHAFETVIFNAGVGDMRPNGEIFEAPETTAALADVNFRAPIAGATLMAKRMAARRNGAIALVSSITSFTPLAVAPGYAASKAGLNMFTRSLRSALRPHGVSVTLICPAFVDTPMSRRVICWKPFTVPPGKAAQIMIRAIERRRQSVIFPLPYAIAVKLLALLPDRVGSLALSLLEVSSVPYEPQQPMDSDSADRPS